MDVQGNAAELWYNDRVDGIREAEYPSLRDTIYLDHAGTAIPAKSLIDQFAEDMIGNICANPHSTSIASQDTSKRIDATRLRLLQYFGADPEEYDVVFVANATAGIKLVAESLREADGGFWFGYHESAHTSIVGMREVAAAHQCFTTTELATWTTDVHALVVEQGLRLLAYPAQSNMNGQRLPVTWCKTIRKASAGKVLTLLDAASLVSTSRLDIDKSSADFVVVSLYKVFGFPDLGALFVRRQLAPLFEKRKYFGGGTVDAVTIGSDPWHARKIRSIHEQIEDGSLPIHNILAVDSAMTAHHNLFGDIDRISRHCAYLAQRLYSNLSNLRHSNGARACQMYHEQSCDFRSLERQGPIVAFNIQDLDGSHVSAVEVEKLASVKQIQLRTGGLCNPGGVAEALGLSSDDLRENYASGQRCGSDNDLVRNRPTGMLRLSLGPANTTTDVDRFVAFVEEYFVTASSRMIEPVPVEIVAEDAPFVVEAIIVYPIKSCAGWLVPPATPWQVNAEGLAWDREWCLVAAGSGNVMNQKRFPKMALIHPILDLKEGLLHIHCLDPAKNLTPISIPLAQGDARPQPTDSVRSIRVCEDEMLANVYTSPNVVSFLSQAIETPCFLARFTPGGQTGSVRHSKIKSRSSTARPLPESFSSTLKDNTVMPILLSNESPILIISRSSLNRLNEEIKSNGGKAVHAAAFRANIVLAETFAARASQREQPYIEDTWRTVRIGSGTFQLLGPCRRCQMVCIDQFTGIRRQEPFLTLAKTRRFDGMIFFGQHSRHVPDQNHQRLTVTVGNAAKPTT